MSDASAPGLRPTQAPVVSVIVPCYNHARYVRETIESVWAQTYKQIELLVIDDASSDDSAQVIDAARRERPFVFMRNESNVGLNATLERGLAHATGEYAVLFGSDDVMLPTKIAAQVEWLVEHDLDGVFATGFRLLPDGRRELIGMDRIARMFEERTMLRHIWTSDTSGPLLQSGLFRTAVLRELAPVRRLFKSDDWAMAIRLLEHYRIGFLNQPVFLYRLHDANAHRDHWRTFPMRAEVISLLTPEDLRFEALGNLLESQAAYLNHAGRSGEGLRCLLAAFALDPSLRRITTPVRLALLTRLGRLRARLRRRRTT